jgi:hypothetical protein
VRLSDGRKEKEGRYLMTFKERRLFVGVARVERFSGGRSVGRWLACLVRGGVTSGEGNQDG